MGKREINRLTGKRANPNQQATRDAVLQRMLKTPPTPHKPRGKRAPRIIPELEKALKENPDLLTDIARVLGQNVPNKD